MSNQFITDVDASIFVAGHNGMVGSAIVRYLKSLNYKNLVLKERNDLDLLDQAAVRNFFSSTSIDYVILAAARVGGIHANNTQRADFIFENLVIETNVIHSAYATRVKRLLFLGSSCIYPRDCEQPMSEEFLLTGALEETNRPYALAKISGIELCDAYNRQYGTDFRCVMPTNLYGPGDYYHKENSHVIPALIMKFHEAKKLKLPHVTVWGTGKVKREFLYVEDLAIACWQVLSLDKRLFYEKYAPKLPFINVGYGNDIDIKALAYLIRDVVDYQGSIVFDESRPDGVARKLLDSRKIRQLGWSPQIDLKAGLKLAYRCFLNQSS